VEDPQGALEKKPDQPEIEAIKSRLDRFQTMFHSAPLLLLLVKVLDYENYRILLANQTAVYISSYPYLEGLLLSEMMTPEEYVNSQALVQACIDSKASIFDQEIEFVYEDTGAIFWLSNSVIPIFDQQGEVEYVVIMARDVTERKHEELRQAALYQETLDQQAVVLEALSTPLLSISDHALVMPLIGLIDARRVGQMLETLLAGVAARHANYVVIDITGVPLIDSYVANGLWQAAQAVRLLGVELLLSGVRPEVAQSLVALRLDLARLLTFATLQDAIAATQRFVKA
jgi:PAS domain S-box-containing protein